MAAYAFTALDERGHQRKGVLEGDTPRQIRQHLRERGWTPIGVEIIEQDEQRTGRPRLLGWRSASPADIALITRQLATLAGSGIPLEEALQTVAAQASKPRIEGLLIAIRSRVLEGRSLAQALDEFPRVFSELYRATIAAGEQSGHLEEVLDRLADYTEEYQDSRRRISMALIYPVIVLVVALLVVTLLLTYVVPQVVAVFNDMDRELPPLTQAMIATSDFLRTHWPALLGALLLATLGQRLLLQRPAVRIAWHRLLLATPLLSRLIRVMNAARFARTLSILSASGVPVLESLQIAAQVITSLPMRQAVEDAARQVREGASLHTALDRSGYFPPLTIQLIASGEASGQLEHMLVRAADSQERELEALVQTMTGLLGPFMILAMGGIVLLIVLAILLPIFNLNQLLV